MDSMDSSKYTANGSWSPASPSQNMKSLSSPIGDPLSNEIEGKIVICAQRIQQATSPSSRNSEVTVGNQGGSASPPSDREDTSSSPIRRIGLTKVRAGRADNQDAVSSSPIIERGERISELAKAASIAREAKQALSILLDSSQRGSIGKVFAEEQEEPMEKKSSLVDSRTATLVKNDDYIVDVKQQARNDRLQRNKALLQQLNVENVEKGVGPFPMAQNWGDQRHTRSSMDPQDECERDIASSDGNRADLFLKVEGYGRISPQSVKDFVQRPSASIEGVQSLSPNDPNNAKVILDFMKGKIDDAYHKFAYSPSETVRSKACIFALHGMTQGMKALHTDAIHNKFKQEGLPLDAKHLPDAHLRHFAVSVEGDALHVRGVLWVDLRENMEGDPDLFQGYVEIKDHFAIPLSSLDADQPGKSLLYPSEYNVRETKPPPPTN